MKVHYFQRYKTKENVDTANAMLLLSRLYAYSPERFYLFLSGILPETADVQPVFDMQTRIRNGTVPDATIAQESFKVAIETKLGGGFTLEQLVGHLGAFRNEKHKVLLTLDPGPIDPGVARALEEKIRERGDSIVHKHLTFEELVQSVGEVLEDRDYELQDMLTEYRVYCAEGGLIRDDWKRMRVRLAGSTFDFNRAHSLYYDNASRGFSGHDYLGLYKEKAVRAIGRVTAIVTATRKDGAVHISEDTRDEPTADMEARIQAAFEDAKTHGWNIEETPHNFFFVERFYDTCFEKASSGALMGTKFFDLCEVLRRTELPGTEEMAALLRDKQWQ